MTSSINNYIKHHKLIMKLLNLSQGNNFNYWWKHYQKLTKLISIADQRIADQKVQ